MMSQFYFVGADASMCNRAIFKEDRTASLFLASIDYIEQKWTSGEIELKVDPDEDLLHGCGVLSLFRCLLVFDDDVRSKWGAEFNRCPVEWIPAVYDSRRWWILRSAVMLDAVCESRSVLTRAGSGRVFEVKKLELDTELCHGKEFFRLARGFESWYQVVSSRIMTSWAT
ncbi:MAG: hypothetical protein NTV94_01035 [Planctomycetota bacterium]|nr:hypothetical protein [Planctomycetota bacterium]